jgi:hypothetical protein
MYGKKKKIKHRTPDSSTEIFLAYEAQLQELESIRRGLIFALEKQTHQNFLAQGGCRECRGRGWIPFQVEGGFDYPPCPVGECTPESRRTTGADSGFDWHDELNGVENPCGSHTDQYAVLIGPVDCMISELMSQVLSTRESVKLQKKVQTPN